MKRLLLYLKLFFFFLFFSVTISAVETSFFYPFVDFNTTTFTSSSFSGSVIDVNTYLENTFSDLGTVSVRPLVDMAISTAYKTSIFSSGSLYFLVNYSLDNIIISAIKFSPYILKNIGGDNKRLATLLSISGSDLYYFKDNIITHYLISDTGLFTLANSLVVESSWELSLVDDMFPSLSSLYLILPFDVSTVVSEVNSLINNLNLTTFGIAGDDFIFTFSDFADTLNSHCDDLKVLILGQNPTESYSAALEINSNCSSLSSVFFVQFDYMTPNVFFNSDIVELFKYKRHFLEL
tara:strand:+ start:10485 stop:11363 length:879 start_codon:yes stop_codon:yes gene_type:complete